MPATQAEIRSLLEKANSEYDTADQINIRFREAGKDLASDAEEFRKFTEAMEAGDRYHAEAKREKELADKHANLRSLIDADGGDPDTVQDDATLEPNDYDKRYAAAWERYIRDGKDNLTSSERDTLIVASRRQRSSDFMFAGRTEEARSKYAKDPSAFYRDVYGMPENSELRAQAIGTDSAGGYLVPEGFSAEIVSRTVAFGGMMQRANVFTSPDGRPLPIPTNDDTANVGEIIGENTEATEQDFTYGEIVLGAFKYSTKLVKVSREFLQDEGVGALSDLQSKMAIRLARIHNQHLTTGTGTAQPRGINTAATVGHTAASATAITYLETLNLKHSVDPSYRNLPGVGWMLNDATWLLWKSLLDADGRPLWSPPIDTEATGSWDGDPVFINQDMPAATTGNKSVLYGWFPSYRVRQVRGLVILRLDERFATADQVAFVGFDRMDGDLIDSFGVRALQMA